MPDHPILEPGTGSPSPATGRLPIARPAARTSAAAERDAATTRSALLSPRSLQLCLGFVWLFVGALQLQPFMFGHGFVTEVILPNTMGQPAAVAAPITLAAHVMTHYPVLLNSLFAGAQILIGVSMIRLALLNRSTVRLVLLVSMAWALSVWWIGEGLGGLLTGAASPLTGAPGAVILYAVLAVLAWPPRKVATASPMEAGRPGIVSPQVPAAPARGEGVFGRVIWIVLWVGSAAMLLAPANRTAQSIRNQIVGSAAGEPGWLASFQRSVAAAAAEHGEIIAVVLAVASLAIGIGVFVQRIRTAALVFGALLSLAYWVVGQAFGGILTGTGTDPNAGALFVLLALALAPGGLRLPSIASLRARIRGVVSERSPARTGQGHRQPRPAERRTAGYWTGLLVSPGRHYHETTTRSAIRDAARRNRTRPRADGATGQPGPDAASRASPLGSDTAKHDHNQGGTAGGRGARPAVEGMAGRR